ncbi:MAG: hypothetical protein WBO10_05690 [Pyrinomonadaceae bacterium]
MRHTSAGMGSIGKYGIDTAFVLLFLAMEYGRAVRLFSIDGILMAITMAMVLVLPYFLPSNWNAASFTNWLIARTSVTVIGLVFGAVFSYSLGTVLPIAFKSLPMTFLILAAMISCYVQYYGLMKLRLAK